MRRLKIDENLVERCTDPDSRVPVINFDGQILTDGDAPLLRELDIWLEEHPSFTPLSEVSLVNCSLSISQIVIVPVEKIRLAFQSFGLFSID